MAKYYVNNRAQDNGDHEVHRDGCGWLILATNTTYLGEYSTCDAAVARARLFYRQSNGCKYCTPSCHTS